MNCGPSKFCQHGIESSAISMCRGCEEDRMAGRKIEIVGPDFAFHFVDQSDCHNVLERNIQRASIVAKKGHGSSGR